MGVGISKGGVTISAGEQGGGADGWTCISRYRASGSKARHRPVPAFVLRPRRHRRGGDLRAGRGSRGGGRRRHLERVSVRVRSRCLHRVLIRRARHQVPAGRWSATYINNAFRSPFISFMVAFAVMASSITSACVLTLAFSGDYLSQFVGIPTLVAAVIFLIVVCLINFYGISESVRINVILTCIEVFGLLLIVAIGVAALGTGTGDPGRAFEFKEGGSVLVALLGGAVLAFYALIGFDDSVNVAEEVRHPNRIYPRAIFGGLLVAGLVYLLVTFTASMVVPTGQLAASDGPLLEVVQRGPIEIPLKLFAAIALLAVSNGALINMIMASRVVYGMGDQAV